MILAVLMSTKTNLKGFILHKIPKAPLFKIETLRKYRQAGSYARVSSKK